MLQKSSDTSESAGPTTMPHDAEGGEMIADSQAVQAREHRLSGAQATKKPEDGQKGGTDISPSSSETRFQSDGKSPSGLLSN